MKMMKTLKALVLPLVALTACVMAPSTHAIPMDYTVDYSGSVGSSFSGSFSWDADTSAFSSFTWNLTATADSLRSNNWASAFFDGTVGQFLFEILTGEDVHPSACSTGTRCTFTSVRVTSELIDSVEFRSLGAGVTDYIFRSGANVLYSGTLSVNRVVMLVSEPFTLLLMGAGLLGFALRPRKLN